MMKLGASLAKDAEGSKKRESRLSVIFCMGKRWSLNLVIYSINEFNPFGPGIFFG